LTNGANHTIRGAGQLLVNFGGMINNGTIIADAGLTALDIDPSAAGFDNRGTLRAASAPGINLNATGDVFTNTIGLVDVMMGSRLDVTGGNYRQTDGQTIVNGLMTTAGIASQIDLLGGRFGGTGLVDFGGTGAHALNNTGGTLAAGNSPAILNIQDGDYVQGALGSFEYELEGILAGVDHDLLSIVNGDADLAGVLQVIADLGFAQTLSLGDQFEVIRIAGGAFLGANFLDRIFDDITVNLSGLEFEQLFIGNSLYIEVTRADLQQAPSPATILVILPGLIGLAFLRRRRR
jgi:hypothetical protein